MWCSHSHLRVSAQIMSHSTASRKNGHRHNCAIYLFLDSMTICSRILWCTTCALTKYTPLFLMNGPCLSPHFKKVCLARCVSSPFLAQVTDTQDLFCHLQHMEYRLRRFTMFNQICRFPYCWSNLSSAHRSRTDPSDFLKNGFSKPLGTKND